MIEKKDQIPESETEHIQESTLIPESHFSSFDSPDPDDQVSVISESVVETTSHNTKPVAEVLKKDNSFGKRNAPYIAVAAVALIAVGAFVLSSGSGSAPAQTAQAPVIQQTPIVVPSGSTVQSPAGKPVDVTIAASTPSGTATTVTVTPGANPIEISNAAAPGSAAAQAAALPPPPISSATPPVVMAEIPAPVVPAAPLVAQAEINRIGNQAQSNGFEINDLKTRVDRLEKNGVTGTPLVASNTNPGVSPVKERSTLKTAQRVKRHKMLHARRASRQNNPEKTIESVQTPGAYRVHIVRDNLAWLRSSDGTIRSFAIGDVVPGIGRLTKINEYQHRVIAGNVIIR